VINPIARDLIVGGSTGGTAALASGDADLGIGTDTAGSIRIPAACTGVHDKAVKLRELELPVLRAMIYETFMLNMCGAPVVVLPDLRPADGSTEPVPFSFQLAGPPRADLDILWFSSLVASHLGVSSPKCSTSPT
jgi:Asp-tRNA(Asn)/Glu-tRNA(Gln) amidotransferase A subunit family amidase